MAHETVFIIDHRVKIAMDALSDSQRDDVAQAIRNLRDHAGQPGRAEKLSTGKTGKTLYKSRVGSSGLRLIFSVDGDTIFVLDLMSKRTMDRLGPKKRKTSGPPKENESHSAV
jgi:mRNA-degrading endonuclease RelE of RelBE toxin-antitoxin system